MIGSESENMLLSEIKKIQDAKLKCCTIISSNLRLHWRTFVVSAKSKCYGASKAGWEHNHVRKITAGGERKGERVWSGRLAKRRLKQADARACNSHSLRCYRARCSFAGCAAPLAAAAAAALNALHAGVYSAGGRLKHKPCSN